jgi:FtsP/CotA-like multicopper oxidase with cupredoxin domain
VVSVPSKRVRFRMLTARRPGSTTRTCTPKVLRRRAKPIPLNPDRSCTRSAPRGVLPAVATHNNTTHIPLIDPDDPDTANPDGPFNLLLAPAERADVVIDFNGVIAGTSFILYNDAPAPFPGGDPRNDYFTGDGDQTSSGGAPNTVQGFGPNTRTLLKIIATGGSGDILLPTTPPANPNWLDTLNPLLAANFGPAGQQPPLLYNNGNPSVPGPGPYRGPVNRMLTLNEDFDDFGRLIQTLGTFTSESTDNQGLPTWGLRYTAPVTENPSAGAVEVWQLFNLTADTHPIHFHLVNVQIIQRQKFTGNPTDGITLDPESAMPPDANEMGWKETVRMNPGEVTTVIMQFTLPTLPPSMGDPLSPRTGGHEYVWHCHILEHEEHDMMRPLVVT